MYIGWLECISNTELIYNALSSGKTTSDLEQLETEEQAISEKLKSQMAQGEEGMHSTFTEILVYPTYNAICGKK